MEMHQLRYFVTVARTGNFSRAAEQCHVAQPSLSQQIQKLEIELGQRLFLRLGRRTQLTKAGKTLLGRAMRVLEEVDAARREVGEAEEDVRGCVTLGILPTVAPYLLPRVVAAFLERFPAAEARVLEEQSAALARRLSACEVDLVLSTPIHDMRRVAGETLCEEELLVALPAGHRLARKKRLQADDLRREPWIVMQDGHCLGDQVLRFREQIAPGSRVGFRCAQLETLRNMVGRGLGISLIPAMAARTDGDSLVYKSLEGGAPARHLVVLWPDQRPPGRAASEFLHLLKAAVQADASPTTRQP